MCKTRMKFELRELEPGTYSKVQVCPKCADEWLDEKEYRKLYSLFKRRTFKIGGSIAVRIPRELAKVLQLHAGDEVKFTVERKRIVIEPT
jgi:Zn-finger nucleic acid-binding protein